MDNKLPLKPALDNEQCRHQNGSISVEANIKQPYRTRLDKTYLVNMSDVEVAQLLITRTSTEFQHWRYQNVDLRSLGDEGDWRAFLYGPGAIWLRSVLPLDRERHILVMVGEDWWLGGQGWYKGHALEVLIRFTIQSAGTGACEVRIQCKDYVADEPVFVAYFDELGAWLGNYSKNPTLSVSAEFTNGITQTPALMPGVTDDLFADVSLIHKRGKRKKIPYRKRMAIARNSFERTDELRVWEYAAENDISVGTLYNYIEEYLEEKERLEAKKGM